MHRLEIPPKSINLILNVKYDQILVKNRIFFIKILVLWIYSYLKCFFVFYKIM